MSRIGTFSSGIQEFDNEAEARACAEMLGLCISYKNGVFFVYPRSRTEDACERYEMLYSERYDCLIDNKYSFIEDGDFSNYQLPYRVTDLSEFIELRTREIRIPPKIPDWVVNTSYLFKTASNLQEPAILPASVKVCTEMYEFCDVIQLKYRTSNPVRLSLMKQRNQLGSKTR